MIELIARLCGMLAVLWFTVPMAVNAPSLFVGLAVALVAAILCGALAPNIVE